MKTQPPTLLLSDGGIQNMCLCIWGRGWGWRGVIGGRGKCFDSFYHFLHTKNLGQG